MCHDIVGIIGRPQVERSLQAWSEVYPEQEGTKLIEKTSIYRHLKKQRNTSWDSVREQGVEIQAMPLRLATGTSSSPASIQEMDISNQAERLRDALCLPPIRRASADNINLSNLRYISHLPPAIHTPTQDGSLSPFAASSPVTRSNRSESPRVLPPIMAFDDKVSESPVFHTPQSSRRASQVSHPTSDKSNDPFQPIQYDPHPHETVAPSFSGQKRSNTGTNNSNESHGQTEGKADICRIPSDKKAGTTFHEIPLSLGEYLEKILNAGDLPFTLAGFRDREDRVLLQTI
ncbi:hypothetical protein FBEOM_6364 [Fusarium beomiforme]|uniref:Uncharacterized protein n=1 Tax=Fusarium beomiforme TaxID=44412 RepID=A0A9P5AJF5_9HYPO|nr:hypothetical protein FBEOM_6364 [Fusarium beomiforme]